MPAFGVRLPPWPRAPGDAFVAGRAAPALGAEGVIARARGWQRLVGGGRGGRGQAFKPCRGSVTGVHWMRPQPPHDVVGDFAPRSLHPRSLHPLPRRIRPWLCVWSSAMPGTLPPAGLPGAMPAPGLGSLRGTVLVCRSISQRSTTCPLCSHLFAGCQCLSVLPVWPFLGWPCRDASCGFPEPVWVALTLWRSSPGLMMCLCWRGARVAVLL